MIIAVVGPGPSGREHQHVVRLLGQRRSGHVVPESDDRPRQPAAGFPSALGGQTPAGHVRSGAGTPVAGGIAPLQSHEIFGYAPYWTLPQSSGFDVSDLTTLAYFSVDANPDGTLDESGSGWNGYESQDLVNLVNRSHAGRRSGGADDHRLQSELAECDHL